MPDPFPGHDTASWRRVEDGGFVDLLGSLFVRADAGAADEARYRFETGERHRNRAGFIHGGLLLALADSVMGRTARLADPARSHATLQIDMQFLKAVPAGSAIEITCRIARAGRSIEFVEATFVCAGNAIASARGIWKRFG